LIACLYYIAKPHSLIELLEVCYTIDIYMDNPKTRKEVGLMKNYSSSLKH